MSQGYQCCFCGKKVDPTPPDVASLMYTTCFDGPKKLRHDQELYCHTECLRTRLYPNVKLYVVDLVEMANER